MLSAAVWALARRQHGVVARWQLLELGASPDWIGHRIAKGRLHPIHRGVYAVGRPEVTQRGRWMSAVLACGPHAVLSHESAAALWGIRPERRTPPLRTVDISVHAAVVRRPQRIRIHRTTTLGTADCATHRNIPVTSPTRTLIDLAGRLSAPHLEAAVSEADKLDLVDPETLRTALDERKGQRGIRALRELLDRRTFTLTDTELERRFLPIVRKAGLPPPLTQRWVNGFRVDFFWPELGLVVETDGLRYHRTPAQQTHDRLRDQAHAAAGLTPLRFTRAQVRFGPDHVGATLSRVTRRLAAGA
jgi:very-short-patch-repair endonuclease